MRRRLLASYLSIVVLTLAVLVVPLGRLFASRERDRLLRDIEHDAVVIGGLSEDALERNAIPELGTVLSSYAREPGGRIVVVNAAGRSVADNAAATGTDFSNRPEIARALNGDRSEGSRRSDTLGGDIVYVAVPVASSGVVHGAVRITYPRSALDERVRNVWLGLAALSAAVLIAVAILGVVLAALVTRPVDRLKAAARAIADGDLGARAPTDEGAPELRELAVTFNETAERLEQTLAAQQAFVADASHQLRTPLAALRLQLENVESAAPPALQPSLAAARAETSRLAHISDTLLALTRASASRAAREVIDVAAVVRDRALLWEPVAAEASVRIVVDVPARADVDAEPGVIEQVLDNLLDNALEVAPAGTTISLSARTTPSMTELHVVDEGPGLTAEQRVRAFDRFWRAPGAAPGGTGLGLAIVAQLVARCGGSVALHAHQPTGIDATVTLNTATFTSH